MAKIIFGSYMFRYPLGGMLSWALQYMLGMKVLGHDVYFVEKAGYDRSCFDVSKGIMTNDCSYGIKVVSQLFKRFGLEEKWCYVDYEGNYHGLSKRKINEVFKGSDIFIDSGTHGSWESEATNSAIRVLIDGEPAYTQIKWANNLANGTSIPKYDRYFTNGKGLGTKGNPAPTLNINWEPIYSPVDTNLFTPTPFIKGSPYSTVMNWQSHPPICYNGKTYGQKDIEFQKFISLPILVEHRIEVAVSGKEIPYDILKKNRWLINDAQKVTLSFDSFCSYLSYCRGEFSVCKNVFVENNTGWFSDKSAAYLASGRPVILQETGFSKHLPTGEGLFAVNNVEEAKEAIIEIESDYRRHSKKAREIVCEFLEAKKVMKEFLNKLGVE